MNDDSLVVNSVKSIVLVSCRNGENILDDASVKYMALVSNLTLV